MKTAMEIVTEIFDSTVGMTDEEYCEFLEEIVCALNDSIEIKRSEMDLFDDEDE